VGQNVISPSGTYLRCLNGTSCTAPATKLATAVGMTAAIGEFISWAPGPEILLGGYVFSSDASYVPPLLTLGGGSNVGLSTLVDGGLDEEGLPETYALLGSLDQTQYTANISAFESNGAVDDEYPKALYGNTKCGSAPQLGDFDGDGNREVLVEITDSSYGAIVALYRTEPGTPFNPDNNPWPMAGHDAQRTGRSYCKQQRQTCSSDAQCCSARCNSGTCQ
ncbi:MAG TPA: hypothetical protein VJ826_06760, partial [Candidatus Polarisedimenticolaceae bacterium]|nr:hypothetical protein [Candidatus Polarisedimenticolaceae bacterium]